MMITYRAIISTLSDEDLAEALANKSILTSACDNVECFKSHNCEFSYYCADCIEKFLKENVTENEK